MNPIIRIENLHHTYTPDGGAPVQALRGVDLSITPGEYVAILGANGSGKSTLAKHLNALLLPSQGDVWVQEWNTRNLAQHRDIRATVGMVFQTPDNQIVATIVEEDVAFGPENLGVPRAEMLQRVEWALSQVEMLAHRHRAPHLLSGGQKQRICIAGVLAMRPQVLILDESTAMLDPQGRVEVLNTVRRLNQEQGVTVVAITHFMHEAIHADRVVIMDEGRIALMGTPREVFRQSDRLHELQLDLPPVTTIAQQLHAHIPAITPDLLTMEELVQAIVDLRPPHAPALSVSLESPPLSPAADMDGSDPQQPGSPFTWPQIDVQHLVHDYMRGTPLAVRALHDINLQVHGGEIIGLLGHTGSGKSTLVQHLNGLLAAHGGSVHVLGQDLRDRHTNLRDIRLQVGLVFQFPEAQLFERYVGDDIAFGPRNLGLSRDEVRERVRQAMTAVGLDFDAFKDRQTFSLSGGQRRRVALAGVLALEPQVLILDEPTAGLDPATRQQLFDYILALHRQGMTLIMISHNMDELAAVCHRLYVLEEGRTVMDGAPDAIFSRTAELRELGLDIPIPTLLMEQLRAAGIVQSAPEADSGEDQQPHPLSSLYTIEQVVELLRRLGEEDHAQL